jgi:hypothetical protein
LITIASLLLELPIVLPVVVPMLARPFTTTEIPAHPVELELNAVYLMLVIVLLFILLAVVVPKLCRFIGTNARLVMLYVPTALGAFPPM